MKFFMCALYETGWCTDYLQKSECIFANDIDDARAKMAKAWGIRKNAKGYRVEEIPYIPTFRYSKTKQELESENNWNSFLQMNETTTYWTRKKRYYCGHCNKEISKDAKWCDHCGAMIEEDK